VCTTRPSGSPGSPLDRNRDPRRAAGSIIVNWPGAKCSPASSATRGQLGASTWSLVSWRFEAHYERLRDIGPGSSWRSRSGGDFRLAIDHRVVETGPWRRLITLAAKRDITCSRARGPPPPLAAQAGRVETRSARTPRARGRRAASGRSEQPGQQPPTCFERLNSYVAAAGACTSSATKPGG